MVRTRTPQSVWRSPARAALLSCLQLSIALSASAAPPAKGSAPEADRLFQAGLEQMRAGAYDTACPQISASYRIDPVPGALFTLAECEAGWKKFSTALAHYQAFVSELTKMSAERRESFEERRQIAAGQIAVLSIAAPTLTLDVAPNLPPNLIVEIDGTVVAQSSYGVGRKVDPGRYTATAEIDGRRVWERSVALGQGDQAHVEVKPEPTRVDVLAATTAAHETHPTSRKTWVYVAGGAGIGGLTMGFVAGALALGKKSTINENCPALRCNARGRSAVDSAQTDAAISTVGFSVGLAGAAAVTLLLVLAPDSSASELHMAARRDRAHTHLVSDGRSVSLVGEF